MRGLRDALPWLAMLAGTDLFFLLLLWLAAPEDLVALWLALLLASAFLFVGACLWTARRARRREELLRDYLLAPGPEREQALRAAFGGEHAALELLFDTVRREEGESAAARAALADYRGYVEAWAHETKTPLALLAFLLDNRRAALGGEMAGRLDYVRSRMQESVDQMLYYARLTGGRKDYQLEHLPLAPLLEEALEDYRPLLEEREMTVCLAVGEQTVYTDRRGFLFLLRQGVSNAVKYAGEDPLLEITLEEDGQGQTLVLRDNGRGVRACDLPYLFERGFTGTPDPDRGGATGMGLYLARRMAEDLHLTLEARSVWGEGFELRVCLPRVEKPHGRAEGTR